ncbi:regulatory protein RecX [bacterium]|nr:regulatory protein RecX [bacterium]
MKQELDPVFQKAKELAINYISYRPRSSKEVMAHLVSKGYSGELAGKVVSILQEYNYIDDLAFAQKWYRTRLMKGGYGPLLIQKELTARGIPLRICEELRRQFYPEEREKEEAMHFAKRRGWKGDPDIKGKHRYYQALIRRGFSPVVARDILKIRQGDEG